MSALQETSVFESFNARALHPSQVAQSFVPSQNFERLTQRRHSVVLGPRGSGKTTLLKMLQPAALEAWPHERANDFCDRIDFTGVFIPFDRSWRAQIDALGHSVVDTPEHSVLGHAAFTTHVFRATVAAFLSRTATHESRRYFRRARLTPADHAELARLLYSSWQLPDGPKSLLGVRAALGQRLALIGALGRQIARRGSSASLESQPELHLPFIEGVSSALDAWEGVLGVNEERWGLLFDELELAPTGIKRELFASLRSRDERLLFKLALSPFDGEVPSGAAPEDPQPGQDYEAISLWFAEKRDTIPFCTELWDGMLQDKELPATSPRAAFGRSHFDTSATEWRHEASRTAYGPGTRWQQRFAQLEAIDPTFREFLHSRGYDSHRLDKVPPASRAAEIRKISPLVAARLFFLRDEVRRRAKINRGRSRKRLTLYAGWETLCAVSEGNPRWFIGIVKQLLDEAPSDRLRVSQSQQAKAIEAAADRYRAALRTIPVSSAVAQRKSSGLVSMLDSVGEYFRFHQIFAPFSAEPPGSFVVEKNTPSDIVEALGQALNAGALVVVDESDDNTGLGDLRGRRFRLCYLLVAYHEAMPRLGRAVALRRILSETKFDTRDPIQLSFT